nr:endonuclease/exonuclease/phosphatase family protein [Methylocucumis oryzae]
MRIITLNANGIRSAERKGFFSWMLAQHADVVCIQETKAQIDQLSAECFHPRGYHCFYHDAHKKKVIAASRYIVYSNLMTFNTV